MIISLRLKATWTYFSFEFLYCEYRVTEVS